MRRRVWVLAAVVALLLSIWIGTSIPGSRPAQDSTPPAAGDAVDGTPAGTQQAPEDPTARIRRPRARDGDPVHRSDLTDRPAGSEEQHLDPTHHREEEFSPEEWEPVAVETEAQAPAQVDPKDEIERTVEAVVRDSQSGAPLANARVLVVVVGRGWHGTRTDALGRLVKPLTKADLVGVERVELRVRAPGFAMAVVPYDDTALEIALEPLAEPPPAGRAEVFAYSPDGKPFEGRVALSCYDPMSDHHGRLLITDSAGRGVLHGLEPGAWRIGVAGGTSSDTHVPSGGDTRVQVELAADEPLTEEAFEAQHRELQELMTVMRSDREESNGRPEATAFETVLRMQTLETRWRVQRPGRDVQFVGLPDTPEGLVRIESTHGPGQAWVVLRGQGELLVPSLPPERWRLVVLRGDERLVVQAFEVSMGEGAQEVRVPAR